MKIHFISFVVVDEDVSWYKPVLHDVSGSYQSLYLDGSAAQSRSEPANLRAKLVIAWSRFTGLAG